MTFSKRYRELSSFTKPAKIFALGSTEMGSIEGCCEMPTKNGRLGKMQIHKHRYTKTHVYKNTKRAVSVLVGVPPSGAVKCQRGVGVVDKGAQMFHRLVVL